MRWMFSLFMDRHPCLWPFTRSIPAGGLYGIILCLRLELVIIIARLLFVLDVASLPPFISFSLHLLLPLRSSVSVSLAILYLFLYNLISRLCHFHCWSLSYFIWVSVVLFNFELPAVGFFFVNITGACRHFHSSASLLYATTICCPFASSYCHCIVFSCCGFCSFRFIIFILSEGNFIRMADLVNAVLLSCCWPFASTFCGDFSQKATSKCRYTHRPPPPRLPFRQQESVPFIDMEESSIHYMPSSVPFHFCI